MSAKGPPFSSLFDILQQSECLKSQRVPFLRIFSTMRLFKILIFVFFFENFSLKTPKSPPSIFLKSCNRMDVKKSQRVPSFTVSGIVTFSKRIIFVLKLGFLRSGTLYPIFVVLKDRCFFCATFLKICFTEAPPRFLPETKRFARVKDSSRFSALCDLPETIKNIFEKFFPQISVFKGFSLRKMFFVVVFSWGRMVFETYAYSFGYFLALYIVKLMKF